MIYMSNELSQLISIESCATLANLSEPGIRLHLNRGNLKGYRVNKRSWAILSSDFAEFLKARETGKFTRQWKRKKNKPEVFNTCVGEPQFRIEKVLSKAEPMQLIINKPTE